MIAEGAPLNDSSDVRSPEKETEGRRISYSYQVRVCMHNNIFYLLQSCFIVHVRLYSAFTMACRTSTSKMFEGGLLNSRGSLYHTP